MESKNALLGLLVVVAVVVLSLIEPQAAELVLLLPELDVATVPELTSVLPELGTIIATRGGTVELVAMAVFGIFSGAVLGEAAYKAKNAL